ncbi:hypothetical protein D3C78_1819080 [compost metagenome]
MVTSTPPSNANCKATLPLSGRMNCGSSTEQNSKALGLLMLVSSPRRAAACQACAVLAFGPPVSSASIEGAHHIFMPSQTR